MRFRKKQDLQEFLQQVLPVLSGEFLQRDTSPSDASRSGRYHATEFVIRDNKNGGVLRAADTLSGGEIFITSLSLALALSSSIQLNGSAPLELFFLDEGFGSLDDELLNIVMDSLERIKTDRRSIGIISHVENLKERVPVKLLIEPSQNTGSGSHIRVQYS